MNNIEEIAIKDFGSQSPGPGCTFIASDGTFINIYPKIDDHEDLIGYLTDNYGIEFDELSDADWFVNNLGWIRLRSDPFHIAIILGSDRPSSYQFFALEEWLEYCEEKYQDNPEKIVVYLDICDNGEYTHHTYNFMRDAFAEDIVKYVKRFYTSGKLYASTNMGGNKMITKEQMIDIQDEVFDRIYNDIDIVNYYEDKLEFEDEVTVVDENNWEKEVTYEVSIPPEDLWDACMSDLEAWGDYEEVAKLFETANSESAETYYTSIYGVYMKLVDMWMNDKAPARNLNTYSDFAYEFCVEFGEPKEFYPPED